MSYIDRAGTFCASVTHYELFTNKDTKAVTVRFELTLTHELNQDDEWNELYDSQSSGLVNIVKGDGTINEFGVGTLEMLGWDGKLASFTDGTFQPHHCTVFVEMSKNQQYGYQVKSWYKYGEIKKPSSVSPEVVKSLDSQYGSQFRALMNSKKRNADPPKTSSPKKPPPAKSADDSVTVAGDDGIPF